jgi:hypothetical protein
MLDQFQARYPTGSLISELLQIHQGKFVVRVSAQVEGVTRATGMAAAETLELAEDRARSRALMVLGIEPIVLTQPESFPLQPAPSEVSLGLIAPSLVAGMHKHQSPAVMTTGPSDSVYSLPPTLPQEEPILAPAPDSSEEPTIPFGNVTMMSSQQYRIQDRPGLELASFEPEDLSDTLSNIDIELQELGWSADQERRYLERVYGKQQKQLLTDDELLDFLRYLELFAKTNTELKRLGWSPKKGSDYLQQTYKKKGRSMLTYGQLLEFLRYLESQPSASETFA